MKQLFNLTFIISLALITSACGQQAEPTIAAADVQNTAVAGAFTMVAQTQASIPTATPLPPTETPTQTPLPTDTPLALPTSATTLAPALAATTTPGGDPCLTRILSWSPKGRPTKIRIVNTTKTNITISIYLNETPDHFECGYRVYNIGPRNDILISDLVQGCYNVLAYNNDPKIVVNAYGSGCINNPDKWTIEVYQDRIKGP
jgi:hypothetical protein